MTPDLNDFETTDIQSNSSETEPGDDEAVWQNLRREVKAISLDLWGTILDDHHAPADTIVHSERRQNFLREELQRHGYEFSPEQMHAAYKRAWQYFDDLWMRQIAFDAEDGVREMLRYLNADLPEESFRRVRQFFEEAYQDPFPLDNSIAAVQALAKKYPLALISDTAWMPGRILRDIFAHFKILDCFRVLIYSGEVGVTKPHPKVFHKALQGLDVRPWECLHVGDLQRTDIAGAKAVGMHTAWVRRPIYAGKEQPDCGPEVVVNSVSELAKKLLQEGESR